MQFQLQLLNLLPQIVDDVLVLQDVKGYQLFIAELLGFYVLGPVRILQSVDGFLELRAGWAHSGNHHRLTVAAQRVFEQSRQLGILNKLLLTL